MKGDGMDCTDLAFSLENPIPGVFAAQYPTNILREAQPTLKEN